MHTSCKLALALLLTTSVASVVHAQGAGVDAGALETIDANVLQPPRVLESPPPLYPVAHLEHGEHPTVVLKITVLADGSSADLSIEHTAGEDFDRAALEAVQRWRFEPAMRGTQPIASRIAVAVHFELPELATVEVGAVTQVGAITEAEPMTPHRHEEGVVDEVEAVATVKAEARSEARGNNDYRLDRRLLEAAPHADAAELLKGAPGMVVARIEGDAVAHRLMLRGFDADHGQDIELSVDGVPVNQPSHIHGQGYADLGFLIPETVLSLRVVEGVYDPAQGDFAVAGSADFELGVEQRGARVSTSYGRFHTFRELALWAPEGQAKETFAAAQFRKSRGFGQNRASTSGSVVAQGALGTNKLRLILHGSAHAARADTANVLRRDDIDSGKVGFYDVYPYPTAESQNGAAVRAQLSAKLRWRGEDGANGELSVYAQFNDFRLLANYTGFTERSQLMPAWTGRGDLIEQVNQTRTMGLKARHRSRRWEPVEWGAGTLEFGASARIDGIDQEQNLVEAPANTTWDRRVDAQITAADIGGYFDADLALTKYVKLKGGVRADVLAYQVYDGLQNFIPSYRGQTHLEGYRRSAAGIATGPRVVLEATPIAPLTLSVAYGEGYRSPQALLLDEGEPAPFTKVRSADGGVRLSLFDRASLRASAFYTHLSQDIVFEPTQGRAEAAGPSTRLGGVFYAEAHPLPWLHGAASVTYVHATLDEPPPRTAEHPSPPFQKGQLLPYVPPVVLRLDASAEHALLDFRGFPVTGRVGLGFTYWSPRPLPYSQQTEHVSLLDGELALKYRVATLSLQMQNLANAQYSALELVAASNWDPNAIPSRIPARHVIAGAPRTWLLSLGLAI